MIQNRRLTYEETARLLRHLNEADADLGLHWGENSFGQVSVYRRKPDGQRAVYQFYTDLIGARYILQLRGDKELLKEFSK